jgi:hypothetical protein
MVRKCWSISSQGTTRTQMESNEPTRPSELHLNFKIRRRSNSASMRFCFRRTIPRTKGEWMWRCTRMGLGTVVVDPREQWLSDSADSEMSMDSHSKELWSMFNILRINFCSINFRVELNSPEHFWQLLELESSKLYRWVRKIIVSPLC